MRIAEALELFKYNHTDKISIEMLDDCGGSKEMMEPTLYREIKFFDVKDYLKYEVYYVGIELDEETNKSYIRISYCDPYGEWK